jgi:hypothetical protein
MKGLNTVSMRTLFNLVVNIMRGVNHRFQENPLICENIPASEILLIKINMEHQLDATITVLLISKIS